MSDELETSARQLALVTRARYSRVWHGTGARKSKKFLALENSHELNLFYFVRETVTKEATWLVNWLVYWAGYKRKNSNVEFFRWIRIFSLTLVTLCWRSLGNKTKTTYVNMALLQNLKPAIVCLVKLLDDDDDVNDYVENLNRILLEVTLFWIGKYPCKFVWFWK
jgi:hypothetical protein